MEKIRAPDIQPMSRFGRPALAVLVILLLVSCAGPVAPRPEAGVLDLSGWDFDANGPVSLNGQWEFYWEKLLGSGDFKNAVSGPPSFITLPSPWYGQDYGGTVLGSFGYATFRLVIKTRPARPAALALKIPKISTAYRLYQGETLIAAAGTVGVSPETSRPEYLPLTADLSTAPGEIELILQVSNFAERLGGVRESILLGGERSVRFATELSFAFDLLCFGCALLFGLYHLNIFLHRRKDFVSLFFGLFCLVIAWRTVFMGEIIAYKILPGMDPMIVGRSMALSYFLAAPLFSLFIRSLYPQEFPKPALIAVIAVSSAFAGIGLIGPAIVITNAALIFSVFTCLVTLFLFFVIIRALARRREDALLFLIGFAVFVVTVLNDIFFAEKSIRSAALVPFGLFLFIQFQVFVLGRRFSRSHAKVEALSESLTRLNLEINELNVTLENKVAERTTELENARDEVVQVSRERAQFFINIAHEIKTPLTLVYNYLELYIKKNGLNNELRVIRRNFQKMQNDILNFLDVERLEKGKMFYSHDEVVDLSDLIGGKMELFQSDAERKGIDFSWSIEPELHLKADPLALERIVNNLLDNALKFTDRGGAVSLSLAEEGLKIHLTVRDTGAGIPQAMLTNVFKPYYQLSGNPRNPRGMGMGLFIVKKTVESLKGKIIVDSRENAGSSFTVVLDRYYAGAKDRPRPGAPVGAEEAPPDGKPAATGAPFPGKPALLIVEDNEDMLAFLYDFFSAEYEVHAVKNGEEALGKLETVPLPDLIISDIMMNGMDGWELADRLFSDPARAGIPVVFLTAKAGAQNRLAGLEKGAVDYISKPFEISELAAKVRSIVNSRRTQQRAETEKLKTHLERALVTYADGKKSPSAPGNGAETEEKLALLVAGGTVSDRERDVIRLLVQGLLHKEIASRLGISVKTVGNHITRIYRKLKVENKVELMNLLMR